MIEETGYLVKFEEEYDEGGYRRSRYSNKEYKSMADLIEDFNEKGMQKTPSIITNMQYTNGTLHASVIGKTKE